MELKRGNDVEHSLILSFLSHVGLPQMRQHFIPPSLLLLHGRYPMLLGLIEFKIAKPLFGQSWLHVSILRKIKMRSNLASVRRRRNSAANLSSFLSVNLFSLWNDQDQVTSKFFTTQRDKSDCDASCGLGCAPLPSPTYVGELCSLPAVPYRWKLPITRMFIYCLVCCNVPSDLSETGLVPPYPLCFHGSVFVSAPEDSSWSWRHLLDSWCPLGQSSGLILHRNL